MTVTNDTGGQGPTGGAPSAPPAAPTPPTTPPPPPPPTAGAPAGDDPLSSLDAWARGIGAREKAEGRAAGLKQAMEAFGDVSLEEAARIVKEAREAEQAQMSEAQRLQAQAEERERKAEERERAAAALIESTVKTDALVAAGLPRDQAAELLPLVQVPQGTDVTTESVATAVEAVKAKFPQLFATSPTPPAGRPTDSQPRGGAVPPTAGGGAPTDARKRALDRLHERHPNTRPQS